MPEVHIHVNRLPKRGAAPAPEDLEEALRGLDYNRSPGPDPGGNVVAVSFEGGRAEQEEIERVTEEAGYKVSRLSVRTDFSERGR